MRRKINLSATGRIYRLLDRAEKFVARLSRIGKTIKCIKSICRRFIGVYDKKTGLLVLKKLDPLKRHRLLKTMKRYKAPKKA